jgi:hypothetical protein
LEYKYRRHHSLYVRKKITFMSSDACLEERYDLKIGFPKHTKTSPDNKYIIRALHFQ